jgi:hypothetical protein
VARVATPQLICHALSVWRVDYSPEDALLGIEIRGEAPIEELCDLAEAHARALEATGGAAFAMRLDLRQLFPLGEAELMLLADMKRVAAAQPGCRRIRILASSPTVALQQRHTSSGHAAESVLYEPLPKAAG